MSEQPVPTALPTPAAPGQPIRKNTIGLVAFILAIVGFLMSIIPGPAAVAWLLLIPAIVLAIIALVQKRKPLWSGLAAIIIAPIAWIIAIIVSIVGFASGVSDAIDDAPKPPAVEQPAEEGDPDAAVEEEPAGEAALGVPVTNNDGVTVTFTSVACGIAEAGPEFLKETAKGQFCEVKYTVQNDSSDEINLWASDVTGEIGGVSYETNGTISQFGGEYFTTALNPGLGTEAVVYIDIPVDAALEYLVYVPEWSFFTDDIRVKL